MPTSGKGEGGNYGRASVAVAARERRVGLCTLDSYRATPAVTAGPQLVLGFGNLTERAINTGITAIADLLGC